MLHLAKQSDRRSLVDLREDVVPSATKRGSLQLISLCQLDLIERAEMRLETHPGHDGASPLGLLFLPNDVPIGDRVRDRTDADDPEDSGKDAGGLGVFVHLVSGFVKVHLVEEVRGCWLCECGSAFCVWNLLGV